jgi:spore coat polysaccharide biosynthesis protein SpsF (cytidylyltransferase family)
MSTTKQITNVLIGIQARSTSERLPGKCFEMIGEKRLLDHVIDAAKMSAGYLNYHSNKSGIFVRVGLLIPEGDRISEEFQRKCPMYFGPEHDVLTRYKRAADKTGCDYVVRLTGDCPLIPPYLISKHIKIAIINNYDYVCNSDETVRTALDGIDCEVISKRLLDYMYEFARDAYDREHVTPLARKAPPSWARLGFVGGFFDQSEMKLSVDTQEDLERVRKQYASLTKRIADAEERYGKHSVHRV